MRKLTAVVAATVLLIAVAPVFAIDVGDEPAVSVRTGELRSTPSFLGAITARVEYGETVRVLEVRGDWVKVRAAGSNLEGWIHNTAVAEKESLRLTQAEGSQAGATSREIALAGRGFNEQVEAQYKSEKDLDFSVVDEMETYGLEVDELAAFLAAGDLSIEEGGAQ